MKGQVGLHQLGIRKRTFPMIGKSLRLQLRLVKSGHRLIGCY